MRSGGVMRVCFTFKRLPRRPLPAGIEKPAHALSEYKAKALDW